MKKICVLEPTWCQRRSKWVDCGWPRYGGHRWRRYKHVNAGCHWPTYSMMNSKSYTIKTPNATNTAITTICFSVRCYAECGTAMASRPSIHLYVCLWSWGITVTILSHYCVSHTLKIISQLTNLAHSLQTSTSRIYSKGNTPKFQSEQEWVWKNCLSATITCVIYLLFSLGEGNGTS